MKSLKLTLLTFGALLIAANTNAQKKSVDWCVTNEQTEKLYQNNPALIQQDLNLKQQVRDYIDNNGGATKKASPWIIPVVVHNITHDGGQGYVSKADIEAQLVTMTEDFKRLNPDAGNTRALFVPYAAAMDVEFRLAHIDPNGNCTEGIVRMEDPLSNFPVPRDAIKSVSYWDSKKYFNIWVIDNIETSGGGFIAGYAQFPSSGINSTYGVVVVNHAFGGGDRTMTHEMGHCFGLLHTFQSGCGSNCSNSGDQICDTPPVDVSTQGCLSTQNSCNNDANGPDPYGTNVVDQIENYMSYDQCQNMFSLEQASTMAFYLNSTSTSTGLAQLSTPANLAATGTANPYGAVICTPIADFSYNKEFLCEGDAVTFTDDSYNATPTGWNWTFTGGTPASSSVANPTITYNTAGVYSVTHQPSTTAGSGIKTKTNIITVSSLTADYIGPIIDDFENTTQFNNDWIINSGTDAYDWQNTTAASVSGSRSIRVDNFSASSSGSDVDYIVSPSYDISTSANKTVKFKVAYANRAAGNSDRLMCYYSLDCGGTWLLKLPITNGNLVTAPDHGNSFVPTSSEWVEKTMDFTSVGTATNIRFKFQFEAGGGNNIYLEDINIGDFTIGVEDFDNIGSFNVYPNPTNSNAQISFNLTKDVKSLSIKVRNAVGQEVTNVINEQSFSSGKYTLKIDEERKLSAGIYFIEFKADNNVKTQKLIIQ